MKDTPHFIPPHGGYEQLLSYQKALVVFDGTVFFVKKWLPRMGDRTVDQMVQAARSGKQNIVEGSIASAMSKQKEIDLTNTELSKLEENIGPPYAFPEAMEKLGPGEVNRPCPGTA